MRIFFFILVSLLLTTSIASAHFLGSSAVDGGEIRWGGSTVYASQWNSAVTKWNALGGVNIAPDNAGTYEDLTILDVNLPIWPYYGMYYPSAGTDQIKLNTFALSGKTSNQKQYTILHELGHSLGLDHSIANNIMYNNGLQSQVALGPHDIADYDILYP